MVMPEAAIKLMAVEDVAAIAALGFHSGGGKEMARLYSPAPRSPSAKLTMSPSGEERTVKKSRPDAERTAAFSKWTGWVRKSVGPEFVRKEVIDGFQRISLSVTEVGLLHCL